MTHLRPRSIVLVVALFLSIANISASAEVRWNALSSQWSANSNWAFGIPPAQGDDVFIAEDDGIPRTVTYDYSGPDITLNSLTLDLNGGTGSATNTLFMPNGFNLSANSVIIGNTGNGAINNVAASNTFQNLYLGNYFGSSGTYALGNQASLSTTYEYIGYGGAGTFTQNNGSHIASNIDIAEYSGSTGVYNLVSGVLNTTSQGVGVQGNAIFNHSGGINSVHSVSIAENASATGVYNLSGTGSLTTDFITVGYSGSGTLNQTGGTNTVAGSGAGLLIGNYGHGAYNLSGTGQLNVAHDEIIGVADGSTGVFTQTGGSHAIGDDGLILGETIGSSGAYFLSGGTLSAPAVHIGGQSVATGTGTFSVSGTGSLTVAGTIEVFNTPGSAITLSGGSITTAALQLDGGSSQFNWTGGALNITGSNALVIGPTGTLGNTTLTAGMSLSVAYGAIIDTSAAMTVDGGSFSGALNNTGFLNINSGTVILGSSTSTGEIKLGGSQSTIAGMPNVGFLSSTGLLHGDGTLLLPYFNNGEIRGENDKRLLFTAACGTNFGQINLQGGTVEFSQALTNNANAQIFGHGTFKVGAAGLTNQGNIAFSGGTTDVFGKVNNTGDGAHGISIAGNANATFWNDVANTSGRFNVNSGSSAAFFGAYSGNGITGGGDIDFESDISPGFSPAYVTFGGNVNLGAAARLNIELGGANPGQYDQVLANGQLSLDGTLNISLTGGFYPQAGQSFYILGWGSRTGEFSSLQTPLGDHIVWNSFALYTQGYLTVSATYYAGDFNRDGHVDAADILAGQNALADLEAYESQYGLSPANTSLIDDLNGDGLFNSADLQYLLTTLKNGGGSANPVPEPSTFVLLSAGSLLGLVALRRNRR